MEPRDPRVQISTALHNKLKKFAKKEGITLKEAGKLVVKAGLDALV